MAEFLGPTVYRVAFLREEIVFAGSDSNSPSLFFGSEWRQLAEGVVVTVELELELLYNTDATFVIGRRIVPIRVLQAVDEFVRFHDDRAGHLRAECGRRGPLEIALNSRTFSVSLSIVRWQRPSYWHRAQRPLRWPSEFAG